MLRSTAVDDEERSRNPPPRFCPSSVIQHVRDEGAHTEEVKDDDNKERKSGDYTTINSHGSHECTPAGSHVRTPAVAKKNGFLPRLGATNTKHKTSDRSTTHCAREGVYMATHASRKCVLTHVVDGPTNAVQSWRSQSGEFSQPLDDANLRVGDALKTKCHVGTATDGQ